MPITERVDPGLLKNLPNLPENEQREILALIEELEEAESKEEARDGFMPFIKRVWPAFIEGRHHKIMGDAFERVARGELKRLIKICLLGTLSQSLLPICCQHGF